MLGSGACRPKHSYDRMTYYAMNNTNGGTSTSFFEPIIAHLRYRTRCSTSLCMHDPYSPLHERFPALPSVAFRLDWWSFV